MVAVIGGIVLLGAVGRMPVPVMPTPVVPDDRTNITDRDTMAVEQDRQRRTLERAIRRDIERAQDWDSDGRFD